MARFRVSLKAWHALNNALPCSWGAYGSCAKKPMALCLTGLIKAGPLWFPRGLAPKIQEEQGKLTKTCLGQPFSSGSCVVRHAKGPSAQIMESRSTDKLPDTATMP